MHKNRKFISAMLAGLTLFSVAPIRAAEIEAVEEEPATVETQDNVEVQTETELEEPVLNENGNIAEDVWETVKWVIDAEGTLTLSPESGASGKIGRSAGAPDVPWYNYRTQIKKVIAMPGVSLNIWASSLFRDCSNLTEVDLRNLDTSNTNRTDNMFYDCGSLTSIESLSGWNTANITWMAGMFQNCSNLTSLKPLAGWNTNNLKNISGMFGGCSRVTSLEPLAGWNTNNLTNMDVLFSGCSSITSLEPLAGWNTDKVTDMRNMFSHCNSITSLEPLAGWNTESVTTMWGMFSECSSITSLEPLAGWNTENVTTMWGMFSECSSITSLKPLAGWDTESVTDMSHMFEGCQKVESADFSSWKTASSKLEMFQNCYSLSQITISSDFNFSETFLPSPRKNDEYTGNWAYGDPYNHAETLTGAEFKTGTHKAGTWYWERKEIEIPVVSVSVKDNHEKSITGTTVEISDASGKQVYSGTAENGNLTISEGLEKDQKYTIKVTVPAGYEKPADVEFTAIGTEDSPQKITITAPLKKYTVEVNVHDAEGKNVAGSEVSVFNAKTNEILKDAEGNELKVTIADDTTDLSFVLEYMPDGYYVKQTVVPEGFTAETTVQNVDYNKSEQKITFVNERIPSNVSVSLTDNHGNAVSGAKITVTGSESNKAAELDMTGKNIPLPASLFLNERYTISVNVPKGYETPVSQEIVITGTAENPQNIEFIAPLKKFDVTVSVTDKTGSHVNGSEIAIYDSKTNAIANDADGNEMKMAFNNTTTSVAYTVEYNPNGYYAKQTIVPEGYTATTLTENVNNNLENQTITFINERIPSDVAVSVRDNHGNLVKGATVAVTDANGSKVFEATTTEDVLAMPETLHLGEIYTVSIVMPFGYETPVAQEVEITGTADEPQMITFTAPLKKFNITLNTKDSAGNVVLGGTANIYNSATDVLVAEAEMNKDATFNLEYSADGYYAKQMTVADGYVIDSNTYDINKELKDQTITFVNNRIATKGTVVVKDNHGNYIDGAVVTITDDNGTEVAELTTGTEALALPENLILNDEYTFSIEAPFGYEAIDTQKIVITGTADKPQEIEFIVPLTKFTVKLNATDSNGNIVSGGKAAIYNAKTNEVVFDAEGIPAEGALTPDTEYVLEYNPDGFYTKQTEALKGYNLDENTYGIKNDLSDQTITFINNLIEEGEPESAPTDKPDNTNQNNKDNKVETGNYTDASIFVGMLGAVIASMGVVFYLKRKNKNSEA